MIDPFCIGCNKRPIELDEYVDAAAEESMEPDDYVRAEEGTYNPENGHFLCTGCYIKAGQPSLPYPDGWKAP